MIKVCIYIQKKDMNGIQVYQHNSLTMVVDISTDLTNLSNLNGFTAYMNILTSDECINVTGSTILSGKTTFEISSEVNTLEPRVYTYEIYISDGTAIYTIINDSYSVLPSTINN